MTTRHYQHGGTDTAVGHGSKRDRILEVAEDVFARYGYLAARIDRIAQTVGIKRPSLFHHFPNKQALYQAVLDRALTQQARFLDAALRDNNRQTLPETELEQLIDATFEFLCEHPRLTYLALHTLAANRAEGTPTETATVSLVHWQRLLERGQAAGVFREVTVAECMALLGGMTTFYIAMPASHTGMLSAIDALERKRLRTAMHRLVKTLVLKTP